MTALDFDQDYVAWVLEADDLERLLAAIQDCDEVIMDLETTGGDEHATATGSWGCAARIVLASLTLPKAGDPGDMPTTWVVPLAHPDSPWLGQWPRVMRVIALEIAAHLRPLINQNVKFDCRWIYAHTGVELDSLIVWDTMVSGHQLDENASTKLKELAPAAFGIERWDDFDLTTPGAALAIPLFDLGLYAARDTFWTWRLARLHRSMMFLGEWGEEYDAPSTPDEIEQARLGKLATWCSMPTVAVLTAVEQRGIMLDEEWTRTELAIHQLEAAELKAQLVVRYAGIDPAGASFAPTSHWFRDWTAAAVEAGDLTIAELTPTGKPRWSKGVLVRQARHGKTVAADLLALRGHLKKAEFLTSWLNHLAPTGAIHATYHVGRVVTGRLSASDPNMQQVTESLKPAFVPNHGYVFIDFDYAQIELRVAAFISRCQPMIDALNRGDDLHRMLAARITGKSTEDVTPDERQAGKSANFGLLYGIGAFGFREYAEDVYGVSFTMDEAHAIHRAFFATWTGMAEWHARTVVRAQQTGQVTSPIGRVRRVPGIHDGNPGMAGFAERAAINSPVQGLASDIMMIAAASIEGRLPGYASVAGASIVGTVHDSILVEAPIDEWERVGKECIERMLNVGPILARMDCVLDVPLAVEAKVGTRWGLADVGRIES